MSESKGILVHGGIRNGTLSENTKEMLGCGRKLADQSGQQLSCLIVKKDAAGTGEEAIAFGADRVFLVEYPSLPKGCESEIYLQIFEKFLKQYPAQLLIMSQEHVDLAAKIALISGGDLTSECIDLNLDTETGALLLKKAVYGGNAQAIFRKTKPFQVVTARAKAMQATEQQNGKAGAIQSIEITIDESQLRIEVLEKIKEMTDLNIEDASIIVSGGRGIGGGEPFNTILKELADALGGVVGSSRPPADEGWVPQKKQIGLTGKVVAPEMYFAIGISGASQHLAGCNGAKKIIAINKDPEANIFRQADFGVIGRYEEIVPVLTDKIKKLKMNQNSCAAVASE